MFWVFSIHRDVEFIIAIVIVLSRFAYKYGIQLDKKDFDHLYHRISEMHMLLSLFLTSPVRFILSTVFIINFKFCISCSQASLHSVMLNLFIIVHKYNTRDLARCRIKAPGRSCKLVSGMIISDVRVVMKWH